MKLLTAFLISLLLVGGAIAQVGAAELVIANVADVIKMDPAYITDSPTSTVAYQIFERLGSFDEQGAVQPGLATSWEVSEDGMAWTFYLKEGIKFHDGTPFNAGAVKYTFERIMDPAMASPGAGDMENVEAIEVVDDYTVSFQLKRPSAAFLTQVLMSSRAGIVSPQAAQKFGEDFSFNPVGTGPFKFSQWEPDNHVTLVKNEDYWNGPPLLDKVVFKPIPEASTQLLELETGGVDMILRVGPNNINRIENSSNLVLHSTPHFNARYVFFNTQRAPMDDIALRQAISHAVPVDLILEAFLQDIAVRTHGVLPAASWAYHQPSTLFDYDPEKAVQVLLEAGYVQNNQGFFTKDGEQIVLDLYSPDGRYPMDKEIAAVIQESLQEIGIKAEISVLEWGAYLAAVDGGVPHLSILGWNQSTGEPANMYGPQFKSHAMGGWANAMFYEKPEVDELLIQGETESDLEKRIAIYQEVQEIIASDAPMIPMYSENLIYATNSKVKGYIHSAGGFDLKNVYIQD